MKSSFNENFEWVTLVSVTAIFGYYFLSVLPPNEPNITSDQVLLFVVLLALLVVLYIIGATIFINLNDDEDELLVDEREQMILLKGYRPSYYVLTLGVWAAMASAFFLEGNFWVMHALLTALVLAQLTESATKIYYYRRGF